MSILSGANLTRIAAGHLKKFPRIVDELSEGILAFTKNPNISAGIVQRAKELKRPSVRPEKAHKQRMKRRARKKIRETSGSEHWDLETQKAEALSRARSVVNNLRDRYTGGKDRRYIDEHGIEREGNAYFLTKDQEDRIREILYPVKLREIQAGTLRDDLLQIAHRSPQWGVHSTGRRNTRWSGGEPKSSGFTTWENITDDAGNLNLVKASENKAAGNIIPEDMRHPVVDTGRMTWDEYDKWRLANPDARSFPITDKKNSVAAGILGVGGTGAADASNILDYGFTPEELQERKDLAASRRQWVGERLHLLNPILSSLTGTVSKGSPDSEQGWRKRLIDPTWGGGLRR